MPSLFQIRGRVRSESGEPVAGALVMGADLGWAETAADGGFIVQNPELALFVWCTGFYPRAQLLPRGGTHIEIVLRAVRMKTPKTPPSASAQPGV